MGASVANALSLSSWLKVKPQDYKGQDLDKALKTYEGLAGKSSLTIPKDLIPKLPKPSVSDIDDCIKKLQSAITELHKGSEAIKQTVTALQAVQAASAKASADLRKVAKTKDGGDKDKYDFAAGAADSAGSAATGALRDYQ